MNYSINKLSFSNVLILISAVATVAGMVWNNAILFGMHGLFLENRAYFLVVVQFIAYQFLHGGFFHLASNALFLLLFGNVIESHMGKGKYIIFFIGNTLFVGIALLFLSQGPTIGISGFAMAILAYYMLELKKIGHPEYKSALLILFINIVIGLSGNISFVGHLAGAIWGGLFWIGLHLMRKK